jgi:hypothetical protein
VPTEHSRPERTLNMQVRGVEHDHVSYQFHESRS